MGRFCSRHEIQENAPRRMSRELLQDQFRADGTADHPPWLPPETAIRLSGASRTSVAASETIAETPGRCNSPHRRVPPGLCTSTAFSGARRPAIFV